MADEEGDIACDEPDMDVAVVLSGRVGGFQVNGRIVLDEEDRFSSPEAIEPFPMELPD